MNNIDFSKIELERQTKLKKYGFDEETIEAFRKKIKKTTDEEKAKLGQELLELISNRNYNEDVDLDVVIELIYKGANIEFKNEKKGDYPLLVCSRRNYLKTFIVLLKAGANINQVNNYLTTATMAAARHGNEEILKILILMGADINARCIDGDNALISAKIHGQKECFDLLVNANAYLNVKNLNNETIVDINSNEDFNILSISKSLSQNISKDITFEDTMNLLDEAQTKCNKIKKNFY